MDFTRILLICKRRWLLAVAVFFATAIAQLLYLFLRTPSVAVEAVVEVVPPTFSEQAAALQVPRALQTNVFFLKGYAKDRECIDGALASLPEEARETARAALERMEVIPDAGKNTARVMLTASKEAEGTRILERALATFAAGVGREVIREVEALGARLAGQREAAEADITAGEEALGRLRGAAPSEGALLEWNEEMASARKGLQQAETRLEELKGKETALLRGLKDLEVMSPAQLRKILGDSPLAEVLERQFKELLDKNVELVRKQIHMTDLHPDIKKIREEIAAAETVFESFTEPSGQYFPLVASVYATAKDGLALEIESRRGDLAALRAELKECTERRRAAANGIELLQRNRAEYVRTFQQLAALKSRKDKLAQAGEELRLFVQNTATRLRVVTPPSAPRSKAPPFNALVWLSFVLAALIAGAACYGAEMLDPRIHDPAQIRACSKTNVLCVIPRVGAAARAAPGAGLEGTFALLIQKLRRSVPAPASIVVAGTRAGAGTTFVVDGLACTAASFGLRVLVIESAPSLADESPIRARWTREGLASALSGRYARRRALLAAAGRERTFSDFVSLEPDGEDFPTVATAVPRIHRLPHGDEPLLGANLEKTMTRLLASAKKTHDLVLIDCPSIAASPHATLLGGLADGVVLVVRAHATSIHTYTDALKRWEGTGLTLLGVVLNGASTTAPAPPSLPRRSRI